MMIDKAGWDGIKNRSRAHAEITHDQGAGRRRPRTIVNRLAPRILKFLSHDRRNLPSRTPQSAVEDRPRRDPVRIAVAEDAKLGIWTNETRATLQIADQPMRASIQTSSSFEPFVCRCIVGSHDRIFARRRFESRLRIYRSRIGALH
jgi:hypothetical protein